MKINLYQFILIIIICIVTVCGYYYGTMHSTITSTVIRGSEKYSEYITQSELENVLSQYIMKNPELIVASLEEMQKNKLQNLERKAQQAIDNNTAQVNAITQFTPVLGNINGDVAIRIFFDYNCGYCKKVFSIINALVSNDVGVKIIYENFPILSEFSEYLAMLSIAVYSLDQQNFVGFHDGLIALPQVNEVEIQKLLTKHNIPLDKLKILMEGDQLKNEIVRIREIADLIGIRGVPAFIINNHFYSGLVDLNQLKRIIADIRNKK